MPSVNGGLFLRLTTPVLDPTTVRALYQRACGEEDGTRAIDR